MKKKVLILITGLGIGGAENFLLRILPNIKKFDFKLVSIMGSKEIGNQLEKSGIEVIYLNNNKFHLFKSINRFKKIVNIYKPHTLLTYLLHADLFGRIFGRIFGIRTIICSIRNDNSKFKILNFLDKKTSFLVDLYLPNSEALIPILVKKNKISRNKIKVVENILEISEIENKIDKKVNIRKELNLKKKTKIITCVARLVPQKNHKILVNAFNNISKKKDVVLLIVGEGKLKNDLKKISNDKVYFLGNRDDVASILNQSNLFILPSLIEGMSNALMEAMALGRICLVSDIRSNKELINSKNGFLFKNNSQKDLEKKLNKIILNKNLNKIAKEAKKTIQDRFNKKTIVEKFENVLLK